MIPDTAVSVFLFAIGLVFLVKGADIFVHSASRLSKRLGIPEFIIGLTIVAFATSLPELAGAVFSSFAGYGEIVEATIIGSNIINLSLIFGLIALLGTVVIDPDVFKRDGYIMVIVAFMFLLFGLNGIISRWEAGFLLLLYFVYTLFLLKPKEKYMDYHFREFMNYFLRFEYITTLRQITSMKKGKRKTKKLLLFEAGVLKDIFITFFSIFIIWQGARLVITQAVAFAEYLQLSHTVIGISLIALGTSLPELGVVIAAARSGFGNMAVGNIVGSNIANILLIGGVAGMIRPLPVIRSSLTYTIPFMLFISVLTFYFIRHGRQIKRWEGAVLLSLYTGFMLFTFLVGY
jgi:cation:H+ antiporter